MKEYKQEIINFITEHNLADVFVNENDFYSKYNVNLYVYVRVSTEAQEFGRQILELYNWAKNKDIKICIDFIFCDKYTGKKTDRKEYEELHQNLKENDYLIVSELSRLGRNWDNTKKEWQYLTDTNINVIILDNTMLSAKLPNEQQDVVTLEYKFVRDIVFNAINYVASKKIEETSRSTKDGMLKAKLHGTKSGRPIGRPKSDRNSKKNFLKTLDMAIDGVRLSYCCEATGFPYASFMILKKQISEEIGSKKLEDIKKRAEEMKKW